MSPGPARSFEDVLVRQCAPTLAGMKPGSIFCIRPASREALRRKVRQWDERLAPLGLSLRVLLERPDGGSVMVYVYRRALLERTLADPDCRRFLEPYGYGGADPDRQLETLSRRLAAQPSFPHEIGVFLGYPLQDVIGFIENRGQNFTCCGFWKSYSDPEEMEACFACYRRCVQTCVRLFEEGTPIEKLAVPA